MEQKSITATLDKCQNIWGKIDKELQNRIKRYLKNPTFDNWDDIKSIIISPKGTMTTIWQAVIKVQPSFPRVGRAEDFEGNIIREWQEIPDPFTVIKAIENEIA